jgi:nicotinamidase-related amidase
MLLDADDCQLVLVDYQEKLMPVIHEHALVTANAVRLAQLARLMEVPVFGTEQTPAAWAAMCLPCGSCATVRCRR